MLLSFCLCRRRRVPAGFKMKMLAHSLAETSCRPQSPGDDMDSPLDSPESSYVFEVPNCRVQLEEVLRTLYSVENPSNNLSLDHPTDSDDDSPVSLKDDKEGDTDGEEEDE